MMQNDIDIQPMSAEHVVGVAMIERLCFSLPWTEACIEKELVNPLSFWLVAVHHEAVVGYIGSQSVLGEADVMNLAVDPEYRRKGIAAALLKRLQKELEERSVYSLTLEVRASNEAAIDLYHKHGYIQVGRRPNYYHRPKEDALILRKEWSK